MAVEGLERICRAKDNLLEEKKAEQRKIIEMLQKQMAKDGTLDIESLDTEVNL